MSNMNACTLCGKADALLCLQCKNARYCSKECQTSDWPLHKLLCTQFKHFDHTKRPSDDAVTAILFPVNESKPKLVWLNNELNVRMHLSSTDSPHIISLNINERLDRRLIPTLNICHRSKYLCDGSNPNKAVSKILYLTSGTHHEWRGPVLVFANDDIEESRPGIKDITSTDFRHAIDYFCSYSPSILPAELPSSALKIQGVRINCVGDREMIRRPAFEVVAISPTDRIFYEHDTSDIADRIGMPIFTRQIPPEPMWANDGHNFRFSLGPFSNPDATFLHLCCDAKAEYDARAGILGWGWAGHKWQNSVGSVIVVRQDKEPLHPKHIEALAQFCRNEVASRFESAMEEGEGEVEAATKDSVLRFICEDTFMTSWVNFNKQRMVYGDREEVSPPN